MNYLEIKNFRKKYNLTQEQLADIVKSKVRTVISWEQNHRNASKSAIALMENYAQSVSSNKQIINEVAPVPEEDYMLVRFEDLSTAAGKLDTSANLAVLNEKQTRLVPKEYGKGEFLVVRVAGYSMDDGTRRSIYDGDEVLIKLYTDILDNLPIRRKLFIIVSRGGSVIKQITEVDMENKTLTLHSFNKEWQDYKVSFDDILQIFTVEKKLSSNIIF